MRRPTELKRLLAGALAAFLLVSIVGGCARASSEDRSEEAAVSPSVPEQDIGTDGTSGGSSDSATENKAGTGETGVPVDGERLVIVTRVLQLEVEKTADAIDAIRDLAARGGGTITDLQISTQTDEWIYRYDEYGTVRGSGDALKGWVTVRVPVAVVERFVTDVAALGAITYQSEGSTDVTQEHVDLSARLANLRAEEARLREFFDSAKSVEDMLAIEAELSRVRGEIESLDAQVTYLERQAALATVTIELTEERPVVRPTGDTWGFREAITRGFQGAADILTFVTTLIIASAPLWILAVVVLLIVFGIRRSKRKAQSDDEADKE